MPPDPIAAASPDPSRLTPLDRNILLLTVLLWGAHAAHVMLRAFFLQWNADAGAMLARLLTWATAVVVCMGVWAVTRRLGHPKRPLGYFGRVGGLSLIACVFITLANETYFELFSRLYAEEARFLRPSELIVTYMGFLWILMAWASLVAVVAGGAMVRERERQIAAARALAQQAQLTALRNQLQPHFLFNALNAISALIHQKQPARAERTLMQLSGFLSRTVSLSPDETAPLREEIELERLYLDVEQVRFPDRLTVHYEVEDQTLDAAMPRLILQPLIENAIKHGLSRSVQPVTLTLGARREQDRMIVWVQDDAQPVRKAERGLKVGLANTRERLDLLYGDAARLVSAPLAQGWRSEITLPFRVEED